MSTQMPTQTREASSLPPVASSIPTDWSTLCSPTWASKFVNAQIKVWSDELRQRPGMPEFSMVPNGSIAVGHYRGPKPATHSWNDVESPGEVAAKFGNVIEGDIRIIFPKNVSPNDPDLVRVVQEVTGAGPARAVNRVRWGQPMEMAAMYRYDPVPAHPQTAIEWEICLNQQPYCEIAELWGKIFRPDEISQQAELRHTLRELGVEYNPEFSLLKELQLSMARYRVIASCCLDHLLAKGHLVKDAHLPAHFRDVQSLFRIHGELPLEGRAQVHPVFRPLISSWLQGDTGAQGLDHPNRTLPRESEQRIAWKIAELERNGQFEDAVRLQTLIKPLQPPEWMQWAIAVQERIRRFGSYAGTPM